MNDSEIAFLLGGMTIGIFISNIVWEIKLRLKERNKRIK